MGVKAEGRVLADEGARGRAPEPPGVPWLFPGVMGRGEEENALRRGEEISGDAAKPRATGVCILCGVGGSEYPERVGNMTFDASDTTERAERLDTRSGRLVVLKEDVVDGARARWGGDDGPGGTDRGGPRGRPICGEVGWGACCGGWERGKDTKFWNLVGRRAAVDFGDAGGLALGNRGIGGRGAQTWSPRSAMATGWLQFEHFTVGRIWETRGCGGAARR